MHKRSAKKMLERKINNIILGGSFYDRNLGETICKMIRIDVLGQLKQPVELHLIPDLERGEVLLDQRGKGSLQQ